MKSDKSPLRLILSAAWLAVTLCGTASATPIFLSFLPGLGAPANATSIDQALAKALDATNSALRVEAGLSGGSTTASGADEILGAVLDPVTSALRVEFPSGINATGLTFGPTTQTLGSGGAATAAGQCLVSSGTGPFTLAFGACSGSASTAWANLTGGTNTTGAFLIGTGSSLAASGTGSITATALASTLSIAAGGTGQTTKANAFNALAPATAVGGLIYGTGTNVYGNLALGGSGTCLGSTGSALSWTTCGGGSPITLQTNGVNNSLQTALNLVAGSNITLTNASGGNVTIAATGGSGTPGGLSTQYQINNAGGFAGAAALTNSTATGVGTVAVSQAGTGGTDIPSLTVTGFNTASPVSDVLDVYAWISGVKTKCFAVEANGNLYTCGNSQTYGTSPQGTPSFVRLYGGGLTTGELSPPYLDLLDFAGNWRSTLAPSTSINGAVCVESTAPTANCAPGTVLMPNVTSAAGDVIVGGTPVHELSAPAQPTQYSTSTGSIANSTTVNWVVTYVNASSQETTASVSGGTTLANSGPYSITVDSPVPAGDAVDYNLYACTGVSCTNYTLQNSSPIAVGTNYTMNSVLTTGAAPPVSNTTPTLFATPTRLALGTSGTCLQSNGTSVVYGACGGASSTFQANGTNLTSSSTINWLSGGPIVVTNTSAGNVQFTCPTCLVQNPTTTAQNTITGQNATSVPLTINGFGNTGGDAIDISNNGWHSLFVNAFGDLVGGKDIQSYGNVEVDANGTSAQLLFGTNSDMITFGGGATGNGDIRGQIAITSATSNSFTFPLAYGSAPVCTLTPTSNPGSLTWWVTTTATTVAANLSASGTITFNYICVGNPN